MRLLPFPTLQEDIKMREEALEIARAELALIPNGKPDWLEKTVAIGIERDLKMQRRVEWYFKVMGAMIALGATITSAVAAIVAAIN